MSKSSSKHSLKKKITHHFNIHLNEYRVHLTSKIFHDAFVFMDGFNACLELTEEEPIREEEVDDFLFKEILKYIVKKINDES